MLSFPYSPLLYGTRTTRMLRLLPSEDVTAPIECQLFNYSLLETKGRHLYEALSYVWGSNENPQMMRVDGVEVFITQNLYAALMHLRNAQLERILWVDAVCINQRDNEEKSEQIGFMQMIYGYADRVVVWLGEAEDNSDEAIEHIRVAAEDNSPTHIPSPMGEARAKLFDHNACLKLLQRPWFERTWILQEVGLARNIAIMCGSAKINGYSFWLGLTKLVALENLNLPRRAQPVANLIKGSIFRSPYDPGSQGEFSMGELLDMYHTQKVTLQHDKIYALIGLSADSSAILPDYHLPWSMVFQQVVTHILPEGCHIDTLPEHEVAMIEAKGYVLGRIGSVGGYNIESGKQHMRIDFSNTVQSEPYKSIQTHTYRQRQVSQWALQPSAKPIQEGDILWLFEGASKPSILRLSKGLFSVIAISATLKPGVVESVDIKRDLVAKIPQGRPHTISAIWQLGVNEAKSRKGCLTDFLLKSPRPQDSDVHAKNTRRCDAELIAEDIVKIIIGLRKGEEVKAMNLLLDQNELLIPYSEHENPAEGFIRLCKGETVMRALTATLIETSLHILISLFEQRGDGLRITEEVVNAAAANSDWSTGIMEILLKYRGENLPITAKVCETAAVNSHRGSSQLLELLLKVRGENLPITKEVVRAAASNTINSCDFPIKILFKYIKNPPITEDMIDIAASNGIMSAEIMMQLYEHSIEGLPVTEDVVKVAAACPHYGADRLFTLLYNYSNKSLPITEEVVKAAAANPGYGENIVRQIIEYTGGCLPITEAVVVAAASNRGLKGSEILKAMNDLGKPLPITEDVVKAAVSNTGEQGGKIVAYLCEQSKDLPISEEMVIMAIANRQDFGYTCMAALFDHKDSLIISDKIIQAAATSPSWHKRRIFREKGLLPEDHTILKRGTW
ncbi:heterokaryon incompatibility protein-domain-containing protein [Aspergillus avenaceus]|uniref:Heterokaryon incompatibility protein-domain-containing protein n=1 Tax=Aspergillus avenaceus TaxID=36643 RepID=A0A5N6U547_ASPAV|nr:heterokaryon incompatibility protein-domain-containing protein [Aspergillus avenaceus]